MEATCFDGGDAMPPFLLIFIFLFPNTPWSRRCFGRPFSGADTSASSSDDGFLFGPVVICGLIERAEPESEVGLRLADCVGMLS